jgi:hypothetical protein
MAWHVLRVPHHGGTTSIGDLLEEGRSGGNIAPDLAYSSQNCQIKGVLWFFVHVSSILWCFVQMSSKRLKGYPMLFI